MVSTPVHPEDTPSRSNWSDRSRYDRAARSSPLTSTTRLKRSTAFVGFPAVEDLHGVTVVSIQTVLSGDPDEAIGVLHNGKDIEVRKTLIRSDSTGVQSSWEIGREDRRRRPKNSCGL